MDETTRYQDMDQKLKDVERYLILQVDHIKRWVIIAAALCAVCLAAILITLWTVNRPGDGPVTVAKASAASDLVERAEAAQTAPSDRALPAEAAPTPPRERAVTVAEKPSPVAALPRTEAASPKIAESVTKVASPSAVSDRWFRIAASAIATGIDSLMPVAPGDRFPISTRKLYCWTRIDTDDLGRVPANHRLVTHRWIHEGEVVHERTVTISSPSFRVFTKMENPGERPGTWRVEVVDASDRELGVVSFRVG